MVRTTRAGLVVGPLALVGLVAFLLARERPRGAGRSAAHAIPAGPSVLVTVDVARLRAGELASLLRAPAGDLGACGEDPLARATTLAIGMPGEGDEFGVAVAGAFTARAITACATHAIEARKGWATTRTESGFDVVADATARGAGVVAARDGGPLLYGGAAYVRRMIEAAVGTAPSAADDPRHAKLRAEIDASSAIVASLSRGDSVEGLRGLAVSAGVGPRIEVRAYAVCDRHETCAGLAALAKSAKEELGPFAKLTWISAAISRASVEPVGATLRGRVDVSPEEAREAFTLMLGRLRRKKTQDARLSRRGHDLLLAALASWRLISVPRSS